MAEVQPVDSVGLHVDPRTKFSILFLKAGFSRWELNLHDPWKKVLATSPFDNDESRHIYYERKLFVAYGDDEPVAIDFQHNGRQLVVPEVQRAAVLDRIVSSTASGGIPAQAVWNPSGRFGDLGSLVVVLVRGDAEGELYQLTPAPDCPFPFVAVVMTGDNWHKVIVRAIAQVWGQSLQTNIKRLVKDNLPTRRATRSHWRSAAPRNTASPLAARAFLFRQPLFAPTARCFRRRSTSFIIANVCELDHTGV